MSVRHRRRAAIQPALASDAEPRASVKEDRVAAARRMIRDNTLGTDGQLIAALQVALPHAELEFVSGIKEVQPVEFLARRGLRD